MRSKLCKFLVDLKSCNFNVFILTETWLKDSIKDTEIFGHEWLVYRKNRDYSLTGTEKGGGVLIAIHRSFDSEFFDVDCLDDSEQIWAKIQINKKSIFLGACYLPPLSDSSKFEQISNSINLISQQTSELDDIIVFGDFNRPNLDFIADEDNPKIFFPCNIKPWLRNYRDPRSLS
jgi:hypothetical protein